MAQVVTVEKPDCPCFDLFYQKGVKKVGTCDLIRYKREDGYSPGSCEFGGDAALCLIKASQEFKEKLKPRLEKEVRDSTMRKTYFETLLK